ncbi:uncharacterized protein VTP21DRAFT_11468 [Calcarisporiella thermophila]|uniref:uncharacterized protein n=1 Tax=Calcarisporiella thermophila TaxID=911321 RepID=UPI003743F635
MGNVKSTLKKPPRLKTEWWQGHKQHEDETDSGTSSTEGVEQRKGKKSTAGLDTIEENPPLSPWQLEVSRDSEEEIGRSRKASSEYSDHGSQYEEIRFKWVDGRRFHDDKEVHYLLPNDYEELDRLIMRHYGFRSLHAGYNFLAPVKDTLVNGAMVLDAGCGPGTWTMDMATDFPKSHFIGIDVSPVFPHQIVPGNCRFQLANLIKGLPFADETFDYVFQRCVHFGLVKSEWPGVIQELLRVLKPGGYLEIVEADYDLKRGGVAFRKISRGLVNSMRAREIEPSWARDIRSHFDQLGLEDVQSLTMPFPLGKFAGRIGELGRDNWVQLFRSLRPYLSQVMNISTEEYDEAEPDMQRDMESHRVYIDIVSTYARKPLPQGLKLQLAMDAREAELAGDEDIGIACIETRVKRLPANAPSPQEREDLMSRLRELKDMLRLEGEAQEPYH